MKGQAHLVTFADPVNWKLAPPVLYGECKAEVLEPVAVDTFTVSGGMLPDFDTLKTCATCVEIVAMKRRYTDDPEGNGEDVPAAPFYVYGILPKKDVEAAEAKQHSGSTISEIENTVSRVGVTKGLL
jgi:hypothetical protein